jgi:phosphoribosyl 1,2-cyclic phosphodiesterase
VIRFASLGSGSRGNCLIAESAETRLLIDCGLSPRETAKRLERLGRSPAEIAAVLITHEHDDHGGCAFAFALTYGIPLWCTSGTLRALQESGKTLDDVQVRLLDGRAPVAIGDLEVRPFTVPHDAREPVQYVVSDGALRLGVLTDLGVPTAHVVEMLSGCAALVLECNHDIDMLRRSSYPRWLKERIAGPLGHLDNAGAEGLLAALDRSRLRHVIAAHLSEQNNHPDLARAGLARALRCEESWVGLATQDEGFDWRELR